VAEPLDRVAAAELADRRMCPGPTGNAVVLRVAVDLDLAGVIIGYVAGGDLAEVVAQQLRAGGVAQLYIAWTRVGSVRG
jgi:hypothetical protein